MSRLFVDQDGLSSFIHHTADSILDYREYLEKYADKFFQVNPKESIYGVCVVDFEEQKSCIYEFERDISYSVTLY